MANPGRLFGCFTTLLLILAGSLSVQADQGKDLYDKLCASCHTIGGGDTAGPDLAGVAKKRSADWLVKVIVEPDKLTASKDPAQAELVKKYGYEMPNLGVGNEDALKIITYISGASGGGAAPAAIPPSEQVATVVTPELIAKGKALLTGSIPLAKGGAPCLSCHKFTYPGIAGGNLSKADLSASYQKMGDTGMRGALTSLKFPTMKKIYADKPLNDDEITALMALFKDSAERKGGGVQASLPLMGGGLFVLLLIGLTLYKRRTR